ncbi:uncharacterized protein LOC141853180 [Brevipalpus obovatus]|uniref:uncharacterized protein LOC141853180 n=1 Tax=Brevipalpus obovatus TaxID=246614 RepID=UPI003D9EFA6E
MSDREAGSKVASQSVKRKNDDDQGQPKPSTSRDLNPSTASDVQPSTSTSTDESQLSPVILESKWKSHAISLLILIRSLPPLISKICGKYAQLAILLMEVVELVLMFLQTFDGKAITLATFKASLSKLLQSIKESFSNGSDFFFKLVVPVLFLLVGTISNSMTS